MSDFCDVGNRVGLRIGVNVNIPILDGFFIKTGLEYSEKGMKYDYYDEEYFDESKLSLNYLEIPILASYAYSVNDNLDLTAHIGPYVAYALSGNIHEKYGEYSYNEGERYVDPDELDVYDIDPFDPDDDMDVSFKRFDFGLRFGIGATIASHYNVNIGYELGLFDILDSDYGLNYSVKNKNLYVSVGYTF